MIKMIVFGYLFFGLVYVFAHRKKIEERIIDLIDEFDNSNYIVKRYVELYPWINKVVFFITVICCEWIIWGYWFIWDVKIMYTMLKIKLYIFKFKLKKKLRKNVSKK